MRIIAHLDLDAFFASVEERDNPRFRGLPVVVGAEPNGGQGRGVVSTANYKAREYGIHSALPISRAWKLSEKAFSQGKPRAIFLPVDMKRYAQTSGEVMKIISKASPMVEVASIDEAYFDLSSAGSFSKAKEISQKIKNKIKKELGVTASVGIGPNKLIAKIASGENKPDGLTVIPLAKASDFIESMSVRALPGIGPKTGSSLNSLGVSTIKDLRNIPKNKLVDSFGKWGSDIYERARAIDNSPLVTEWESKSIGAQETFQEDTLSFKEVMDLVDRLIDDVVGRFKKEGFKTFKGTTLTVRFEDFRTLTRSYTFKEPISDKKTLRQEIMRILMPFFDHRENPKNKKIRLVGVRIEKLE